MNRALCWCVCGALGAFAADHDDARASRAQGLAVPLAVAPRDGEAVVVHQRCELLREGVAQRDARGLQRSCAPPSCQRAGMKSNAGPGRRGRRCSSRLARTSRPWASVWAAAPPPPRESPGRPTGRLASSRPSLVRQRGLRVSKAKSPSSWKWARTRLAKPLVGVGQEGLEGVAGQEDQPEPLAVEVEPACVVLDPAYGQAGGLCFKARPL